MQAFNTKTASTVTGASERQLRYWDKVGVVKPSLGQASGRGSRRLYGFIDLVQAAAAKRLREEGLSLQKLRRALRTLKDHPDKVRHPLAELRLVTDGRSLFRLTDNLGVVNDILKSGQLVHLWAIHIKPLCDRVQAGLAKTIRKRHESVEVDGRRYRVRIEPDVVDGGFIAECHTLAGCVTEGETAEEALRNVRDAIVDWLAADQEHRLAKAE